MNYYVQAWHRERREWIDVRWFMDSLLALIWLKRQKLQPWGSFYRLVPRSPDPPDPFDVQADWDERV
jgi:hypothetical protein